MRVLHVLHNSLPLLCGYSIRSGAILRHQRQQGLDLVALTSARNPNPSAELVDHVDGIRHFRTARLGKVSLPILHEQALMRTLQLRAEQVIAETRPDIVHAHSPVLVGLPALRAARDHGLPFVYEVRDLWENASVDRGKFRYNSPFYRLARRAGDTRAAPGRRRRHDLRRAEGRPVGSGRRSRTRVRCRQRRRSRGVRSGDAGSRCSRAMGIGRQAGHRVRQGHFSPTKDSIC